MSAKYNAVMAFKMIEAEKWEAKRIFGHHLQEMLRDYIHERLSGESTSHREIKKSINRLNLEIREFDLIFSNYEEVNDESGCERMQKLIARNRAIIDELENLKNAIL